MPKACEHGLKLGECLTCSSPKFGAHNENTPKYWTFTVEQSERGWDVWSHDSTGDNIGPKSSYPNAYKAAARLLQLMDIKLPVTPQNWPERICMGELPDE